MRLGPFELFQPLASGGMSEVWSAWHVGTGVFAAVKLIPPERVDRNSRRALEREIRTAAALDHPGIVWVYDQGIVDARTAADSGGRLVEGSPYLVMEYASHSLRSMLPIQVWGEMRTILVGLLDALAHAHARGVIHRDLKPGNVLVAGPDDLRPGLKLTDFGIAHALDRIDPVTGARKVMGTPRYMAPEQVDGDWRSLGPGTDLYSLGCLIFRCLTGHGPFRSSGSKLLLDHLRTPAPPLELPEDFPADLASWVAWLLEKDPARRPSSAAAALEALPDGPHLPLSMEKSPEDQPTTPLVPVPTVTLQDRKRAARRAHSPLPGLQLLPVPARWRRARSTAARQLRDAGRALLGLRQVPMAGRNRERDRLWTTLRQCANRGEPGAFALIGTAGLGRTRLLDWFGERTRELGCGSVLAVRCLPRGDLAELLREPLLRTFLTSRLAQPARKRRVEDVVARLGIGPCPLVELALDPKSDLEAVMGGMRQLVDRLKARGPVLVTFDDVHHHPQVLELAESLVELAGPVLVVLSAQEDALAGEPELRERLQAVSRSTLVLEPLTGSDWSELVASVLPLTPTLAATVEQRSRGNPRFAIELLTDWAQRGVLVHARDGFDAPPDLALPQSMRAIWSSRVRHVLADLPERAEACLEIAAALGMEVELSDMRALLPHDEVTWQALITRLDLARLTHTTPTGFAFSHPALREVVLARAERAGRSAGHHKRIAAFLASGDDPRSIRRRGRHRAAAGDREGAFADLFLAAQQARTATGINTALVLLDECERLLPSTDPRKAEVLSFRARTLVSGRRYEAAQTAARAASALAEEHGWKEEYGRALAQLGVVAYHRADLERARRLLEKALSVLAAAEGDPVSRGIAANHLGWIHIAEDNLPAALTAFAMAERQYASADTADSEIFRLIVRADKANFTDDLETADAALEAAWELANDPPQLWLQLQLRERRAYLAARLERYDRALQLCQEMLGVSHALSPGATTRLRVLYAYVCIELERYETARENLSTCLHTPQPLLEDAILRAGLIVAEGALGNHAAIEPLLRHLEASTRGKALAHPILSRLLELAPRHVNSSDHRQRLLQLSAPTR